MFAERYVYCLGGRTRFAVLLLVLLATLSAAPFCFKLGSVTTTQFSPAPGSQSEEEENALKAQFPNVFYDRESLYVQCQAPANCTCTGPSVAECQGYHRLLTDFEQSLDRYQKDGTFISATSFFDFTGPQLSVLGLGYYNKTASSMTATLLFSTSNGDVELTGAVQAALTKATALSSDGWKVYLSGKEAAQISATENVGKTIGIADGSGMILIVLLFAWQVRSWRLTLIPILNTVICLIIARALVYPLAKAGLVVLPSYVPNVVLFLAIALSVDYSFFHLSRFQEVRKEGADFLTAVEQMVTTGGRVVLVSGVILMLCWLALAAFPVFGTNTLGYCASITIFVCIAVNLLMNPVMILAFEGFFSRSAQDACRCCRRRNSESSRLAAGSPLVQVEPSFDPSKNAYASIARKITTCPGMILVPVIVYAFLLPPAIRLFDAELVVGGINGNSDKSNYALQHLLEDFPRQGGGVPMTVLLTPNSSVKVKSNTFFASGCQLANLLQARTNIAGSAFRGIMLGPSTNASEVSCTTWDDVQDSLSEGGIYAWAWDQSVTAANTSSLLTLTPSFDVFSNKARDLVTQARAAVAEFRALPGYGDWVVECYHPMAVNVDAEALASGRFPWVVAITAAAVFCIVGLRYQAALVPLKLFFTIALPIIAVLGSGVYVFQDGALNWTGIPSLQSQGGLVWINPIACTFMLIGFGLDYDIFLFSRIYATRKSGMFKDDREAIVSAVALTGPVITTAGLIMALAFIGMVAQHDNPFLCQMGFTMILGVLVDTFVVRTLLVPAILAMAGKLNWWPGKMPSAEDVEYPPAISLANPTPRVTRN